MKTLHLLPLLLAAASFAYGEESHDTLLLDNERVRVFETRLAPGESTPMHSHPSFLAYSLSDSTAKFTFAGGATQELTLKPGLAAWNEPVTHSVENTGKTEFRVLHVELKETGGNTATQRRFINESDVQWKDAPPSLPKGCKIAVLEGDPAKPGPFSMRIKFPAGTRMPPHWHPADERATVLKGTLKMGLGDVFDESSTTPVASCGFSLMPAGTHHFGWFPEETILQLNGNGPWKAIYVNTEDPRNAKQAAPVK